MHFTFDFDWEFKNHLNYLRGGTIKTLDSFLYLRLSNISLRKMPISARFHEKYALIGFLIKKLGLIIPCRLSLKNIINNVTLHWCALEIIHDLKW